MQFLVAILAFVFFIGIINFGTHFFLYISTIQFFSVTDPGVKMVIAGVFIALSLCFIVGSFLAHLHDNFFTRGVYTLSATWLGYLLYFGLSYIAAWIIWFCLVRFGIDFPRHLLGVFAVSVATLTGLYGLWNAANIRIVEVPVSIKNLPDNWDGKRIVQISDVHMGHTLRQDFLWEIVDRINALSPEFVCITGDFYDGMDGSLEHLSEPLDSIKTNYGVFYVDGNHETYLGTKRSLDAIAATKTVILHDEVRDLDGLQVVGVSFPERNEKKEAFETLRSLGGFKKDKPYVFLYHKPWRIKDDGNMGSGLALFGHTHEGQLFPLNFIVNAIFGKFAYGQSRVGDLNVYVSSGVGTWGPPMRVGTIPEVVVFTLHKE